MQVRPRRSVLYMPGSNERALEKAKTLPADALILDLEDAVAPDEKPRARHQVCTVALETRVFLDVHFDVEIAWRRFARPR